MRIAEYKQISEEVTTVQMPVDEFNDDGETIGHHMETVEKRIPVMGMVYRDMTEEEVEEMERRQSELPDPVPTIEDRMTALENEVATLKSYINSIGKTELVGEGTYENPFTDDSNPINNAYYLRDGKKYVYMDGQWAEVDW